MTPVNNWPLYQPAREWYHPTLLRQCRASRHRHSERRGYTGTTCSQSRRKHTTKSVSRWMMPRRRTGVWTNPQANGADERLPLLSDRERQRLIGGPNQPVMVSDKGANKHSNRRSNSRRGAPADKQQAQMARRWRAAPARPFLECRRGRAAARRVQAGEAIAAIAATHERKIGAITARLVRLGLITEDGVVQPG